MAGSADEVLEKVRALAPEIRERAPEAEALRRMPPDLVAKLKAAGVFRIYAPRSHGGLELDFPEGLKLIQEVAKADGFTLAGASALYDASPIQRRLRDMNAATQHAVVQKQNYQGLGAALLAPPP